MPGRKSFKSANDAVEYMVRNKLQANVIALPPELEDVTDEEEEYGDEGFHQFFGGVEIDISDDEGDVSGKYKYNMFTLSLYSSAVKVWLFSMT